MTINAILTLKGEALSFEIVHRLVTEFYDSKLLFFLHI